MSIDEHYGFISSVGFQQKLIVKFLLHKEWKTKQCCEVSRFILNNFRTKSPKYDTNQFLSLNSLWSWVYVRCFLTNTTAISTAMDIMIGTIVTKLFPPHVCLWSLTAVPQDFHVLNEHDPQRLSASLSTPHSFLCHECRIYFVFIVNFSDLLKVLQSHLRERRNIYRKKKTS